MKYSTKLSDTIHLLIFLYLGEGQKMTSAKIAGKCRRQIRPTYPAADVRPENAGLNFQYPGTGKNQSDQRSQADYHAGCLSGGRRRKAAAASGYPHESGVRSRGQYSAVHRRFLQGYPGGGGEKMNEITLWDIIERYYEKSRYEGDDRNGKT